MRITQGTGTDLAAARLDAVRTAGAGEALVFTVPEEEPEATTRRAQSERDDRDRERRTGREPPSVERSVEVSAWAAPVVAPVAAPPPRGPEERSPSALDREPRKTTAVSDARPEGRAPAPSTAKSAPPAEAPSPAAPDGPVDGGRASERPSHEGAAGEAKARPVDRLPEVEGAAPAAAPDAAPTAAAARAPAEAVASAAAQAAVETVVVPAGAPAASAALAVAAKGASTDPRLLEPGAKGATETVGSLPAASGALPTVSQRQSDNGLTPVNASAPAAMAEGGDPLRARLQDALRSSVNQRVLQQAASGEVVLPGLGRVAVTARSADSTVAVEVHAAQAATAQMLHARAGDLAADVISADIPLSTLTFAGAGTWSQSDGHAPAPERDPSQRGPATEEAPVTVAARATPAPAGRVRIVL
jgi:hypothetical protein